MSLEEEDTSKPIMFLGKDVRTVPCFRTTMLTSITTGLVAGIGYCFVTGNFKKGPLVGIGSFMATLVVVWIPCRLNYSYTKQAVAQAKKLSYDITLARGTDKDVYQKFKTDKLLSEENFRQ